MIEKGPFVYRVFLLIFWVGTCFGFVSEELCPPLSGLRSFIFLFIDILIILLCLLTIRVKWHKVSIYIFLLIAFFSTIVLSKYSIVVFLNGSRDFFGILFVIPVLYYFFNNRVQYNFIEKFDRHLKYFLYLQCLCTLWQFFKYGPGDYVGGSLGAWNSGILSMLIYMTSFYLINKNFDREHYLDSIKSNWIYIFLLFPTLLNETKASFIFLLFYLILLFKVELKTILKLLCLSPIIIILLLCLLNLYANLTSQDIDDLTGLDFYENYLVGQDPDELVDIVQSYYEGEYDNSDFNEWNTDIPRFTKISLLPRIMEDSKGGILFGEGVGQMKGNSLLSRTNFSADNSWYIDGTRTWIMACVIQIGIIGFIWFFVVLLKTLDFKNCVDKYSTNIKLYLLIFALFMFIYNDAFSSIIFCIFYFYIATSTLRIGK